MAKIYGFPKWPRGPRGMVLLETEQVWREKAFPEREWVVSGLIHDQYGRRRVTIEPINDRTRELSYSESYFRKHFEPRIAVVLRMNSAVRTSFRAHRSFKKLLEHTLKIDVSSTAS